MSKVFVLKNDQYRRVRGGSAAFLALSCAACNHLLAIYQKDGPGNLVRCYLNRFFFPPQLAGMHRNKSVMNESDMPNFRCQACNALIGVPMKYQDGRLAYRLVVGSFRKRRFDNKKWPEDIQ